MKISVIVPVHNGAHDLRLCLEALHNSTRQADEIVIVDDASTDESTRVAYEYADRNSAIRVLELGGQAFQQARGPAFARNRGAQKASGEVLVFFDADVFVHEDTIRKIEKHFAQNPEVAALFGSYDDEPTARGLITRYKNLLHHFVHQRSRREAETFWTGCGAIRRDIFLYMNGFDENFARPSIEDIELGRRLRRANYVIHSCPDIQVTHGKNWTLGSWLRTDIFARAVPWTRLMMNEGGKVPNDLNLDWKSRASAVCAWLAVLCCVALFFVASSSHRVLEVTAVGALGIVLFCNAALSQFFWRRGGIGFALGASALHFCYFLYSSATWGIVVFSPKLRRHGLMLLLLATLFKGLAWSVIVPPWQASDEPQQFLYGQRIAQEHHAFPRPIKAAPLESWLLADAVQLDKIRFQQQTPIDLSDRTHLARLLAQTDAAHSSPLLVPDEHKRLITSLPFMQYHPPLYATLLAGVQSPLSHDSIRWRLLASRWVSLFLGLLVVGFAFGVGREIWPRHEQRALILATLVSFQPILTFTLATISNEALEIALYSALLWMGLRVWRRGLSWRRALFLGIVTGCGLLTKISFASALPLLMVLLIQDWRLGARRNVLSSTQMMTQSARKFLLERWALIFLVALGVSAWWYRHTFGGGSDLIVTSFRHPENKLPTHFDFVSGYLNRNTANIYGRTLISYWCNFGWPDARAPIYIWMPLAIFTFYAIARVSFWLREIRCAEQPKFAPTTKTESEESEETPVFPIFWLACASVALIVFYFVIDLRTRMQLGGPFGQRGQYYLPAVVGQMTWLMLCLKQWPHDFTKRTNLRTSARDFAAVPAARTSWSWRLWLLAVGMIALNWECLFGVVAPRYYGRGSLPVLLERATVIQPVSLITLEIISLAALAFSLALALALSSAGDAPSKKRWNGIV